jgi:phage repressor protein C with HTH and peptisase S24 domain
MRQNRIKILCAEHDISVRELADRIGMNAPAMRRYTRQEAQPRLEMAQKIAVTLGVTVEDVVGVDIGEKTGGDVKSSMPLYGAAQGGIGFDITDVTDPIDAVDIPPWLASVVDAYAVYVSGTSMQPRFSPRDIVYVHPGRPYRQGDYVVVQLKANGQTHAIVKQFIEITDTHIVLQQHDPDQEMRYKRAEVSAIHVIIGTYFS